MRRAYSEGSLMSLEMLAASMMLSPASTMKGSLMCFFTWRSAWAVPSCLSWVM